MALVLGIDAGTTSIKVVLFDDAGRALSSATEEYRLNTPFPDRVELDPRLYWTALQSAVRRTLSICSVSPSDIHALAISSQGETLIALDSAGQPLRNAIVWLDNRSGQEAADIEAHFGRDTVYMTTGSPEVVPTWAATKILWLKRHEADIFKKARRFLLLEDYLIYRLTGELIGDFALYTSSLLVDIVNYKPWDEMLSFIGISSDQLPPIVGSGYIVGPLTCDAAEELGLSERTLVVTAGMDQACGAVGSGNIAPGVVTETTGGSLNLLATIDEHSIDSARAVPIQCHILPDTYIALPWCQTAGMVLKWFRDGFCAHEVDEAIRTGGDAYDLLSDLAGTINPGCDGLIMLPHLAGAMCPEFDMNARGVFFGIDLSHGRAHFVRAIMESIAYMLRRNIESIREMGIDITEVRAMGGAANSAIWTGIKADVLHVPVVTMRSKEAACLGAAIVAGAATGVFGSIEDACNNIVRLNNRYMPKPENKDAYDSGYERYVRLYECLANLFPRHDA